MKRTLSISNDIDKVFEDVYRLLSLQINKYKNPENNKGLSKAILHLKNKFKTNLQNQTIKISEQGTQFAISKNKELLHSIIKGKGSQEIIENYLKSKLFKVNVRELSPRIWRTVSPYFKQIEILLNAGFYSGKSAKSIANDLRKLAKNPTSMDLAELNELLEAGKINKYQYNSIKKNIVNYKPGRGVYKSATKNAYRVARNEFNFAYRRQDYNQVQSLDFVKGWRVHLSGQHPITDMCDDLQGDYPKKFSFTGWHVNCICFATPILATDKQIAKIIQQKPVKFAPIKKMPSKAEKWIKTNKKRIKKMKSPPYWINDNDII